MNRLILELFNAWDNEQNRCAGVMREHWSCALARRCFAENCLIDAAIDKNLIVVLYY